MTTRAYLKQKYGFTNNATIPAEMLCDELLCSRGESMSLAKGKTGRNRANISFDTFIGICTREIEPIG